MFTFKLSKTPESAFSPNNMCVCVCVCVLKYIECFSRFKSTQKIKLENQLKIGWENR